MKSLVNDVIESLESLADEKRIEFAKTSYPTSMKVLGVTSPNQKIVLKELHAQTKNLSGREKLELAKALINTNIFECQHTAFEYLSKQKDALNQIKIDDINQFQKNMDNWVSVDCFGVYIVGYAWSENIISTDFVKTFYNSNDFWIRRIALVATVTINQKARGGKGDTLRTLEICELAIDDHKDLINKALSWALRELVKIDKAPVIQFINQHKTRLHSRVLREVQNKIEKGYKN